MHHNCHIFQSELLHDDKTLGKRSFRGAHVRNSVVFQGLAGSGKSTIGNGVLTSLRKLGAIDQAPVLFPYFSATHTNLEGADKPMVVLEVPLSNDSLTETASEARLEIFTPPFHGCRSLTDSLWRDTFERGAAPSAVPFGGLGVHPVTAYDVSSVGSHFLVEQGVAAWNASHKGTAPATAARVTLIGGTEVSSSMRLVESQRLEDRPAMHLLHTVVFVMSADEAFSSMRGGAASQTQSSWEDHTGALVASMAAVVTCDGARGCKCCLVVNDGRLVKGNHPRPQIPSIQPPHEATPSSQQQQQNSSRSSSTTSSSWVEVDDSFDMCVSASDTQPCDVMEVQSEPPAQTNSAATSEQTSRVEARMRLGRQWRIPPSNVFIFNGQRALARTLASCVDADVDDTRELHRLANFLMANHSAAQARAAAVTNASTAKQSYTQSSGIPPSEAPTVVMPLVAQLEEKDAHRELEVGQKIRDRDAALQKEAAEIARNQSEIAARVAFRTGALR